LQAVTKSPLAVACSVSEIKFETAGGKLMLVLPGFYDSVADAFEDENTKLG